MIIEQPEAFRTWLTAILKPLCEADPEALAKYVLALIKKDKSEEELQKIMVEQLEVFLENETEPFVKLLLQTLDTQDYITTPVIPNANPPNPMLIKPAAKEPAPAAIAAKPVEAPLEPLNGSNAPKPASETVPKRDRKDEAEKSRIRGRHRSTSRNRSRSRSWDRSKRSKSRDRDHKRGSDRLSRTWRNKSPPSAPSSTHRLFERRRSRTPTSPRGRSRSRSPPKHGGHRSRYRNRTPARSASRSRSRSLEKRAKEHLSRSGTPTQDSNHGDMDLRLTNSTQSIQSVVVQQQNVSLGQAALNKRRCRDFDEKGYCMRGEMCPFDHGVDPVVLEDSALSSVLSYNPNGGEGGPPPMGGPPLMGGPRGLAPEYNPQAPQMWNRGGGFRGPRPPMGMPRGGMMGVFPAPPNMQRELIPVPVMDNKNEQFGGGGGGKFRHHHHHQQQPHHHGHPHHNQLMHGGQQQQQHSNFLGPRAKNPANCSLELKKIPHGLNTITHLNNHFSKFGKPINIQVNYDGDPEAAIVTFSSHAEANAAYRSTEAVLNNRFIKVFWHNGNVAAAAAAAAGGGGAASGQQSINNDGKQENVPPIRSIKDRLGTIPSLVAPNTNKVLNLVQRAATTDNNETNQETNADNDTSNKLSQQQKLAMKDELKAQQTAAIKKNQELLAAKEQIKKNQDEQRKNVLKIKDNLRKRKQELLEKQLSQQKILIDKMEKTPAGAQRDTIWETIKKTQESIDAIRKDLSQIIQQKTTIANNNNNNNINVGHVSMIPTSMPKLKKEDVQREMLDAELDLITKQQEGADTSELQMKLNELKAKATGLINAGRAGGMLTGGAATATALRSGRGGGGGAASGLMRRFNPMKRHLLSKNNLVENAINVNVKKVNKSFQKHTVDHRPTRLLVSGYETDEQESVLNHFQTFGEVADYETDATLPSITLNYKTRKEAEMALLKGKHFQDRTLSITWCNNVSNNQLTRSTSSGSGGAGGGTRQVLLSETDEDRLIDSSLAEGEEDLGPELSEEVLLQDDEEEDEENEDRSWRR